MVSVCNRHAVAATILLLLYSLFSKINATTITTPPRATSTATSVPGTCEFRTINYITDSLPQQCLRSSWSNANATSFTKSDEVGDATIIQGSSSEGTLRLNADFSSQDNVLIATGSDTFHHESSVPVDPLSSTQIAFPTETENSALGDADVGELNEAFFLSYEDWKQQELEKTNQRNANIGNKKGPVEKKRDSESIQNNLDSFGDEGEIDLDFSVFRSRENGEEVASLSQTSEPAIPQDPQGQEGTKKQKDLYRSKDAGKTCKERFSYSSFDAGATVLKTHIGAKNSKAVLIENKDTYMLSECAAENKFIIIELSV